MREQRIAAVDCGIERKTQLKALTPFVATALHATTAEQHGDGPFDASSKALSFFEIGTLLVGFARGSFLPAALWDAHHLDAALFARLHILLTKEASIRTIQVGSAPEVFLVAFQGRFHLLLIARVSLEHFVLRDQPFSTFGKKNFVARTPAVFAPCRA